MTGSAEAEVVWGEDTGDAGNKMSGHSDTGHKGTWVDGAGKKTGVHRGIDNKRKMDR